MQKYPGQPDWKNVHGYEVDKNILEIASRNQKFFLLIHTAEFSDYMFDNSEADIPVIPVIYLSEVGKAISDLLPLIL